MKKILMLGLVLGASCLYAKSSVCVDTVGIENQKPVNINICIHTEYSGGKAEHREKALINSVAHVYNKGLSITTSSGQNELKKFYDDQYESKDIDRITSIKFN